MTLRELNTIQNSLAVLITSTALKASVAYRANKFAKKVSKELRDLNEARNLLVRKYGVKDGDALVVPPSREEEFKAELDPLLDLEVDLNPLPKFTLEEVKDAGLSALNFGELDFLITE